MRLFIICLLLLSSLACDFKRSEVPMEKEDSGREFLDNGPDELGPYVHSVYVWLADPRDETERKAFLLAMKKFIHNLPYAELVTFGEVVPSEREVVDSSYDYSFIVSFNSEEDMRRYETDPAHKAFLAETKELIDHIVIYDSRDLME